MEYFKLPDSTTLTPLSIPCILPSIYPGERMLSEILKLLNERGAMSLKEIALHFRSEAPAMLGMLETLERKGRIQRLDTQCSRCKGCLEVKPEDAAIFKAV